ncbi:MAG: hypothetical protein Q8927_04565 [Bacteroidota bacterium]|nr:hypothetical protein [Bacteroidota bacterium]MDP4215450.1 hypothetical protein [Bacteroidota bacterium]MDP4244843.1 hypothetical protein [Bacteroidota bacterium]MDP4255655.1 hypothetical protein [Bacteroidota bacterium]MDP4257506.1 hypothetical protein [Bacteroidota bacterium]
MQEDQQDERPPLFRNWRIWYALVIGFLILLIVFFYFFTKHFA